MIKSILLLSVDMIIGQVVYHNYIYTYVHLALSKSTSECSLVPRPLPKREKGGVWLGTRLIRMLQNLVHGNLHKCRHCSCL